MNKGAEDNKINILISKTPKNYNENFINSLIDKRTEIICNIVRRIFLESNF